MDMSGMILIVNAIAGLAIKTHRPIRSQLTQSQAQSLLKNSEIGNRLDSESYNTWKGSRIVSLDTYLSSE